MVDQEDLKKLRLLYLNAELFKIAAPVGSLHGYWDVTSDITAFVNGRPTIVTMTADEWIAYAEKLLWMRQ
jgi:hypothetical protein